MHPVYVPDLAKKDKYGFCLADKLPHIIGDIPEDKGGVIIIISFLIIIQLGDYKTINGIRSYHCIKFAGEPDKAYACVSPAIIYDKETNYLWKLIKKPTVLHNEKLPAKKRKSVP